MSFLRILGTLALGYAAARGVDRYRKAGGLDGVKDQLRSVGEPGGMADQMGAMAEKFGLPGGAEAVRGMMAKMGAATADGAEAAEAGVANLAAMMSAGAAAGTGALESLLSATPAGAAASAMAEDGAKLMIRVMIQAAKADGEIDADERAKIMALLDDAGPEELAFVEAELAAPMDFAALAAATGATMRTQVYSAAVSVMKGDTEAEAAFLDQLAAALSLEPADRARIDAAMGLGHGA